MAQSASLAESKAIQARQNLEKYVFGSAVSTVPPVVTPALPRGATNYPSYPYVNSAMKWSQGTPPLAVSSIDPRLLFSSAPPQFPSDDYDIRRAQCLLFL